MRDERVFISSVMRDFEPQRAAAKAAVNLLGMRPVMAEDFPAKSHSSQIACLEGVALSNIMVLVLGPRYGFVAASGKSVTEEEFDEARRRGVPVLTFLQKGDREADQESFIRRLRSYEKGYHMPSYSTPQELKDLVVQALNDYFGNSDKRTLDAAGASVALERHSWGSTRLAEHSVWMGAVLLPTRHEQLISIRQLGSTEFQNGILREAVYGTTAIFGPEQVERIEKEESTVFKQEGQMGPIASLEVCMDGTLIFGKQIGGIGRNGFSIVRRYVIDHDEFHSILVELLGYAETYYRSFEASSMLTSFYFGGSLTGVADRAFGRIPNPEPSGMGLPGHSLGNVVHFPKEPLLLPRAKLIDAAGTAGDLTEGVARTFRTAKAYYTQDPSRF